MLLTSIACISASASSIFVFTSSGKLCESRELVHSLLDTNHEQQSDLNLLHQINTKMGELHHNFWWRSFSDRQKQARTEEEAKLTNEKFGSYKNLSEEMKARIAAKVNEDKISYGEWKELTKPISDKTYTPSLLDASEADSTEPSTDEIQGSLVLVGSAVDPATKSLTSVDIPQSGVIEKQKKYQRRKGRRREVKNAHQSKNIGMNFTEPNSPSKSKLVKQAADDPSDKFTDEHKGRNAILWKRKIEKSEEIEEAVSIGLSHDNQRSSSISVVDKDERNGKTPKSNKAYEETDTASIVIYMDAAQTGLASGFILDPRKGKGKESTGFSRDPNINKKPNASSKVSAHSRQPSDFKVDKPEGKTIVENPKTKQKVQIIDLTSDDTFQAEKSSGRTLDKENGGSTDAIAENEKSLDIAFDEEIETSSNPRSSGAEKVDEALVVGKGVSSNSATPQNPQPPNLFINEVQEVLSHKIPAQDVPSPKITLDEGEKASSSNFVPQNVIPFDVSPGETPEASSSTVTLQNRTASDITCTDKNETSPSNVAAQDPIRLNITLDAETGKLSVTAKSDGKNGQSADVVSNQDNIPLDITINTGTGERSMTALLDGRISQTIDVVDNPSVDIVSNQYTRPVETAIDTRNEKTPNNAPPDEENTQGINAVIESPNATQHVPQPPSYNPKGNVSVKSLADKINGSGDFTRKVAIPKKEHLDILHNKMKVNGKGKAPSDSSSNDHNIYVMGAKPKMPSEMTLHEGKKGKASTQDLSDKKIHPDIETANKDHQQMAYPAASLSTDQTNKLDLSTNAARKIVAQRKQTSQSVIDQGKRKESAKTVSNNTPDQHISATNNSRTKTVHFNETLGMSQERAAPSERLTDETMVASGNAASDDVTDKGLDSEALADNSPEKTQGSNSTLEKKGQNASGSQALKIHDQPASHSVKPPSKYARGATGLKWTYFTHTIADEALLASGFWLFEKPRTYFEYQPYHYVRRGMGLIQAPIAVATYGEDDLHEPSEPSIDIDNIGVWINSHEEVWHDVRSKPTHPDFQTTSKLLEYQACESLGIAVWRHDRNLLNCRLPECKAKIADHNASTKICLGCGPKTIIRYCSEAHRIADLREHWKECGQPEFLMKRVIDATTSPARFGRLWPAIQDRSGDSSYERSRQATYAAMQQGRYTLFDPETEAPTTLIWPIQDRQAATMEDRMERLLNYALFDHKHGRITDLLYRMVRQCLIRKSFWAIGPIHAVKTQFAAEFGCDVSKVAEQPLCECEWVGARLPRDRHVAGCKRLYLAYSAEYQATGIQGFLEMMEGRFWVLRAWRQRHPTVDDWKARVSGQGFVGGVDGVAPFFGPGWSGWGSPADNLVD